MGLRANQSAGNFFSVVVDVADGVVVVVVADGVGVVVGDSCVDVPECSLQLRLYVW